MARALVANNKGHVAALKQMNIKEYAELEARHWNEVYNVLCVRNRWEVRMKTWMGMSCVVMPVLSQFMTNDERLVNLDAVRECLQLFSDAGCVHDDVYWRNVGYFKTNDIIVVQMLDLHSSHVSKQSNDGYWIETAIQRLAANLLKIQTE
jgi:Family of unknown function (DUF5898)